MHIFVRLVTRDYLLNKNKKIIIQSLKVLELDPQLPLKTHEITLVRNQSRNRNNNRNRQDFIFTHLGCILIAWTEPSLYCLPCTKYGGPIVQEAQYMHVLVKGRLGQIQMG